MIELQLANEIKAEESSSSISSKKIEIKLKKVVDNMNWMSIEKG